MGFAAAVPIIISAASAAASVGMTVDKNNREGAASDEEGRQNQALANSAAADAVARGTAAAGVARIRGTLLGAKQNVAYANSGVDAGVGTAADVQGSTAAMSELDAKTLENNAAREAWGFKTHGMQFAQAAELGRTRRSNENVGTVLGGLGAVASAAAGAYGKGS